MTVAEDVQQHYASSNPLKTRIETHQRYSDRQLDLDGEVYRLMQLTGDESMLDVGCGPGLFTRYLRGRGHSGRIVGYDQSAAMLVEGRGHAVAGSYAANWVRGDAMALPFKGGLEWVLARHMLYHVTDIPTALREFARVLAADGRLLVVTNATDSAPNITALNRAVRQAFGLAVRGERAPMIQPFGTAEAPTLLGATFPHVEEVMLHNAFIFREPEPIAAYIASGFVGNVPNTQWQVMYDWLLAEADKRLREMGGVWRDSKDVGVYICSLLLHHIPPQHDAARLPDLGDEACARKLRRLGVSGQ